MSGGNVPPLRSWKEIATYLHRTVRTVQRWERENRLPVHRHVHNSVASVYAYPSELDAWWVAHEATESVRGAEAQEAAERPESREGFLAPPEHENHVRPPAVGEAREVAKTGEAQAAGEAGGATVERPIGRLVLLLGSPRKMAMWPHALWSVGGAVVVLAVVAWWASGREHAASLAFDAVPGWAARATKTSAVDSKAYELYRQGREHWNRRTLDDLRKAIVYFSDATEKDRTFAPAYAGLADAYLLLPTYSGAKPADVLERARAAALRAIELDDKLAEPHASLAYLKQTYDWDFDGAEREFRRAIKANPDYAPARHWYALFLKSVGRRQQAIAEMQRALQADPTSLIISTDLGVVYMIDRQYDRASEQFRKTLDREADFGEARHQLAWTLTFEGRHAEALEEFDRWNLYAGQPAESFAAKGYVYGRMGRQREANAARDNLLRMYRDGQALSYHVAVLYAGLGDAPRAFEWLERAYNDRILVDLPYHPMWDPLRSAPGFDRLVQRIAFPPAARHYLLTAK